MTIDTGAVARIVDGIKEVRATCASQRSMACENNMPAETIAHWARLEYMADRCLQIAEANR